MFDLVERNRKAAGRKFSTVLLSIAVHVLIIGGIVIVPLLYAANELPTPHDVVNAFVAAAPAAPPPPPPPPPPPTAAVPKPVATTGREAAPIAPPEKITAEIPAPPTAATPSDVGVPGGVVGGIAGGVVGGTVGGIPDAPAPQEPVRVGGQIKAPNLAHRVEPQYPPAARAARLEGVVILEATVDGSGQVQSVKVIRSIPMLDQAAIAAVKQWRYSPLMLNGKATPFILTVTVKFSLG